MNISNSIITKLNFYDIPLPQGINENELTWYHNDYIIVLDTNCFSENTYNPAMITIKSNNIFTPLNKLLRQNSLILPIVPMLPINHLTIIPKELLDLIITYCDNVSIHMLVMTSKMFFSKLFLHRPYSNGLDLTNAIINTYNTLMYRTKIDNIMNKIYQTQDKIIQTRLVGKIVSEKQWYNNLTNVISHGAHKEPYLIEAIELLATEEQMETPTIRTRMIDAYLTLGKFDKAIKYMDNLNINTVLWFMQMYGDKCKELIPYLVSIYSQNINDQIFSKFRIYFAKSLPLDTFKILHINGYWLKSRRFSNAIIKYRTLDIIEWFYNNKLLVKVKPAIMNFRYTDRHELFTRIRK